MQSMSLRLTQTLCLLRKVLRIPLGITGANRDELFLPVRPRMVSKARAYVRKYNGIADENGWEHKLSIEEMDLTSGQEFESKMLAVVYKIQLYLPLLDVLVDLPPADKTWVVADIRTGVVE